MKLKHDATSIELVPENDADRDLIKIWRRLVPHFESRTSWVDGRFVESFRVDFVDEKAT